ncbi:aminotransferase class V-fold PLP-dependent enzyme [Rhizobium sp. P40RR-XXII]|uniref:aminotransferase class V-fold PLP-dependent enzyme n=1 Tax=Rhizobium sp. P40RR-XXII TaxID=2726739 RepID=UPI001456BAA8|nr:aminotransferase class V-fold PLP-dependent enzyme [Rhizobium sp. P40RR-XXII]NLS21357.1 aminotransferase class V-fold PLP-dependent enzyme [Rhizobium sp. P40RR-XXII]
MTIDVVKVRRETPGVLHRIHLNNAGSGLMPLAVLDAMLGYLTREAEIGGYEAASEAATELDGVYDSVARLLGASRDEIALTENATVAWQLAFYALSFQPGDRILTTRAEYAANYVAFLQVSRRTGAVIEVIPDDADGVLDPQALEQMIDDRVKIIAITWVPTNGGLRNPAAAVGEIARRRGVIFLLDACQAVGQMPTRVDELGCDILTATGRKFLRGPRGTGFLYVRRDLMLTMDPPMIDHFAAPWVTPDRYKLRGDARRFETWENNYAARLGLGRAVDYALQLGLEDIETRCSILSARLREGLRALPGIVIHDLGRNPVSIVSFSVENRDATTVKAELTQLGYNVSISAPSSTLLDATARHLPAVVRASPHYYNTDDEIESFVRAVASSKP